MFASDITSKLIYSFWSECIRLYENNIGTFEDIDKVCKFGFGHKRGAFEAMDEIGLDRVADDLKILFERTKDKRFSVPKLLVKLNDERKLGEKTGAGFYSYSKKDSKELEDKNAIYKGCLTGIRKVGVVGFGLMGRGIVQVVSESGFEIVVRETSQDLLNIGTGFIEKILAGKIEKGK